MNSDMKKNTQMGMWTIALMAFLAVWGFGNIINGFFYFNGMHSMVLWIVVFVLYFIPYALIVGELGSAFKEMGGGVSDWISSLLGPRLGFLAGWTYFVVHIPYLVTKANNVVIGLGWSFTQSSITSTLDVRIFALLGIAIFVGAYLVARGGLKMLGRITSIAGMASLVMSLIFIVVMVGWVLFDESGRRALERINLQSFTPVLNAETFFNMSILIFAVGGIEKIAPYVNQLEKPRFFTGGIVLCVIMVNVCALLGTVAMGLMFDSENIPHDLLSNGAYYAFQMLGENVGLGNFFVITYAVVFSFQTFSVIVLNIDAPIRTMLCDSNRAYISSWFYKQNKRGIFINAYRVVFVIVIALLIIPALGIPNVDGLIKWLIKMNSVVMPLRYLWVFAAYIALKKCIERFKPEYTFTKSKSFGIIVGGWCLAITAVSCILGVYSDDMFEMVMNIVLPIVLVGTGAVFILRSEKTN